MNIKDYLHLYLGQLATLSNLSQRMIVYGWEDGQAKINGYLIDCLEKENSFTIKPILRPLSDMTEEEARQFCISEGWGENLENIAVTDGGIDFTIARTSGYCRFSRLRPSSFITLLSKGFDLFGLIEAGLAIDKTKV